MVHVIKKERDLRRIQRWRNGYDAYLALCGATVWPRILLSIQDESWGKKKKKLEKKTQGKRLHITVEVRALSEWRTLSLSLDTVIMIIINAATVTSVSVAGGALQPLSHIKSQLSKHC